MQTPGTALGYPQAESSTPNPPVCGPAPGTSGLIPDLLAPTCFRLTAQMKGLVLGSPPHGGLSLRSQNPWVSLSNALPHPRMPPTIPPLLPTIHNVQPLALPSFLTTPVTWVKISQNPVRGASFRHISLIHHTEALQSGTLTLPVTIALVRALVQPAGPRVPHSAVPFMPKTGFLTQVAWFLPLHSASETAAHPSRGQRGSLPNA